MKKFALTIAVLMFCSVSYAGQLAPVQKGDAVQKSAFQKSEAVQKDAAQKIAVQKGEDIYRLGFFGRLRAARSCRSGSCNG